MSGPAGTETLTNMKDAPFPALLLSPVPDTPSAREPCSPPEGAPVPFPGIHPGDGKSRNLSTTRFVIGNEGNIYSHGRGYPLKRSRHVRKKQAGFEGSPPSGSTRDTGEAVGVRSLSGKGCHISGPTSRYAYRRYGIPGRKWIFTAGPW